MAVNSQAHTARHLNPGAKLGKYELIRQIAIGGMAELFLARTVGLEGFEKLVVVKRILPQFAETPGFIQMFLDEARLAATLHHPNIAQVYDIGIESGSYFFSMEYVHGEDLRRIIASSTDQGVPLSLDAALTLAVGVAAGLHYAHQKAAPDGAPLGIVHRDVSPSNVLVSYEGGVKVVDFGIARATSKQSSTLSGGLKGKIAYMSPEQCRGGVPLDRRSDIFSIGTMLYEMSTGSLPFTAETEFGVLNQIVNNDVEPPTRRVPAYPAPLETIVLRAMSRDPAKRYSTALELQRDLEDFAHDNRLRISPLTLGRLMETLFPAALAEWENAVSQGAYFVEECVVKTLVGKTIEYQGILPVAAEDEPTTTINAPIPTDDDHTDVVVPLPTPAAPAAMLLPNTVPIIPIAIAPSPTMPTVPNQVARTVTPPPGSMGPISGLPQAIRDGLETYPGAVSGRGIPGLPLAAPPPSAAVPLPMSNNSVEQTARVNVAHVALATARALGNADDIGAGIGTAPVSTSRRPILIGLALIVAAAGIAAATVVLQKQDSVRPATPVEHPVIDPAGSEIADPVVVEPVADVAPAPALVAPAVTHDPAPVPAPAPAVTPDPTPTRKATSRRKSSTRIKKSDPPRKAEIKKPEAAKKPDPPAKKPDPDPPKEEPWTDDSPFMPVRPDK